MGSQDIIGRSWGGVDVLIDTSESYDFELDVFTSVNVDVIICYSNMYDLTLGIGGLDYELWPTYIPDYDDHFILTEDDFILETENEYYLLYTVEE